MEVIEIKITGMSLHQIKQITNNLDSMGVAYQVKDY